MDTNTIAKPSWFQRFLLPGFAFKAVVIGGGYATGRELAEFFIPSGPWGGLIGILLAMMIWSLVCAITFAFARLTQAYDYRSMFRQLLGPFWIIFEISYLLFMILILAVVAAAAGAIGEQVFGLPPMAGTLLLIAAIVGVTTFGNQGAEQLFKYGTTFIYVVYGVFLVLAIASFGGLIGPALTSGVPTDGWVVGGVTYASYNVVAVVAVLPFLRRATSQRDALIAGALAGPLAMLPALIFFLCMAAFYPAIGAEALPSDFLLQRMGVPWFQIVFQLMIFVALLETGAGCVNAFNERIGEAMVDRGRPSLSPLGRLAIATPLLVGSAFGASQIGLVDLIATGYGAFGYIMLVVFVLPIVTIGVARVVRSKAPPLGPAPEHGPVGEVARD
ncbi:YkvI family membrane protein [Sphingosinicella rhizophila]|uniref:Membrane protein YkvI n=1 Tax=Sphingosinicella rhizophila TaxID=3050082 RepID=A0ABU3Q3Y0_9SPHN|nr:hypothetical protein [Sphingosinicella sp. GR2756]MDT9598132.1 hypothetical protein [Sphingosinicella sp. GR2756]